MKRPNAAARIGLGTVQFGQDYGVSNSDGRPAPTEIASILSTAFAAGVRFIDTATGYGEAEAALGEAGAAAMGFSIISKTPAIGSGSIDSATIAMLDDSLSRSLENLRLPRLDGLLVHHGTVFGLHGAERLVDWLESARHSGRVDRIGVSVYDAREIDVVFDRFVPEIVQLPLNIADQRPIDNGVLTRLHRAGVEVHARSVFLQGLLLMPSSQRPNYFAPVAAEIDAIRDAATRANLSPLAACLGFVLARPEVDAAVIGVAKLHELEEILATITKLPGNGFDGAGLAINNPAFVNPANWPS